MKKEKKIKDKQTQGYMAQRRQILNKNSNLLIQEAYKSLRTNIRFYVSGTECKKFCITSGAAGEGKSITLLNLAISIAESGKKVLLIDADLRRPAIDRLLAGLADYESAVRKELYPNLDVIFAGEIPPNPSELIGSERMQKLIEDMSEQYEYILVDTPPVSVVSDACLVANYLDGVVLLVWQGRSRKDAVKKAVNNLNLIGAKLLGYVLNGVPMEKKSYQYYYY